MTLRPSVVTPASMKNLRPRKENAMRKMMVIDCKNDTQWRAIHAPEINGVVLRRRPIRAIESYLGQAPEEIFQPHSFICAQSRLRSELNKHLVLKTEEDELRRKFLVNDIANWVRVLVAQSRSRDYHVNICDELPSDFEDDAGSMKMILTYRGTEITFRQPKDKDERSFSPYGTALFRGAAYECPVEWKGQTTGEKAFYLTIEPHSRGMRRR